VYIPWIDLDLNEASGDVLIAGGILEGRELKVHYKGTRGENGTLRVGLSAGRPGSPARHFCPRRALGAAAVAGAGGPGPGVSQGGGAPPGGFRHGPGTLRLTGTHTDVAVEVQASELDVKARYEPIPYPWPSRRLAGLPGDGVDMRGVDVPLEIQGSPGSTS